MWNCKKCNEEIEDKFDFCSNCGCNRVENTNVEIQREIKYLEAEIDKFKSRRIKRKISKLIVLVMLLWIAIANCPSENEHREAISRVSDIFSEQSSDDYSNYQSESVEYLSFLIFSITKFDQNDFINNNYWVSFGIFGKVFMVDTFLFHKYKINLGN